MKKIVLLLVLAILSATAYSKQLPSGDNVTPSSIDKFDDGKIKQCTFEDPQTVTSPLGKVKVNSIEFYQSGKVKYCDLSSNPTKIKTPVGTLSVGGMGFYESGKIKNCTLSAGAVISTPAGKVKTGEYCPLNFYESGSIKVATIIEEIPLKTSLGTVKVNSKLGFYETGKVSACQLSADVTVKGMNYNGKIIGFDEGGTFTGEVQWDMDKEAWVPATQ